MRWDSILSSSTFQTSLLAERTEGTTKKGINNTLLFIAADQTHLPIFKAGDFDLQLYAALKSIAVMQSG